MTNASCADCGRIVAFRTQDPSEIAECRNCGTWVKRSAEMPGVAVSVKQEGPVARKTAIPARKDESNKPAVKSTVNTTRSAAPRSDEKTSLSGETLSATSVYSSIRDLQNSVHDLRAGQRNIQASQKSLEAGQKSLQAGQTNLHNNQRHQWEAQKALNDGHTVLRNGQKALNTNQKALFSGQKQLFEQYQELKTGQETLLERILPLTEMPSPKDSVSLGSTAIPLGPLSSFEQGSSAEDGFYTTPFSSLKIPLIPIALEDLGVKPQYTEEGSVPAIPADERSDQRGLIEDPLPEPPPYVEPVFVEPENTGFEEEVSSSPVSPFEEFSFDDSNFKSEGEPFSFPEGEFQTPQSPPEDDFFDREISQTETPEEGLSEPETSAADSFSTTAAHASPFTIEGPPDAPFTIAEESEEIPEPEEGNPFKITPQPFGAQEFTHDPCELDDPFASELDETSREDGAEKGDPFSEEASPFSDKVSPFSDEPSPFSTTPKADSATGGDKEEKSKKDEKSLSQQIAAAKEQQGGSPFKPSQSELHTAPEKSYALPLLIAAIGILAAIAAYLFFFTDTFKGQETETTAAPPLIEVPSRGLPLPENDARVAEAEEVATRFLQADSRDEVEKVIQPVDPSLLVDFWEPITAPTIERLFQGRILDNDRVEVDFLINDIKGKERLLPLVKVGEGPFQVDWKNFAECEDATLLGLAQGTLILDSGEELTEGDIRSFVQDGEELKGSLDLVTYQGFKLHNFTEEVVALGVVRKDSPAFELLTDAIAHTELKHKGKPAIRAVLRVKLIEEEDLNTKKPARLEILNVISIDGSEKTEDEIIQEKLPEISDEEAPEEEAPEEEAAEEPAGEALPPVPADTDPLAKRNGETPLFQVLAD